MRKMTLSKAELLRDYSLETPLSKVFRGEELRALTSGQIVCRFSVNDLALTESDEKKFHSVTLNEVTNLSVESQSAQEILRELLDSWVESIPKMVQRADSLAHTVRFKGFENNYTPFVDLIDSCQYLVDSLISLRSLCSNSVENNLAEWNKVEQMTLRTIKEALSSFELKELNVLSDVLEYDLAHCLQCWLDTLKKLRENLTGDEIQNQILK